MATRARKKRSPIEITLGELSESVSALNAIVGMELPARQAFLFARAIRAINSELKTYNETLDSLREKYLVQRDQWQDPDKPEWKTESGEMEFSSEAKALNDTVVALPIQKLAISQLEGHKVQPMTLANLLWLIDEDQGESSS
jgi:hypothetical protein